MKTQKSKPKPTPCYCDAYPFPHRTGGGSCRERYPQELDDPDEMSHQEIMDYERDCFNRREAAAFHHYATQTLRSY